MNEVKTLAPPDSIPYGQGDPVADGRYRPGEGAGLVQVPGLAGAYPDGCQFLMADGSGCSNHEAMGTEFCMPHLRRAGRYESTKAAWEAKKAADAEAKKPKLEPLHRKAS